MRNKQKQNATQKPKPHCQEHELLEGLIVVFVQTTIKLFQQITTRKQTMELFDKLFEESRDFFRSELG
jgi:hypothetical protein